MPDHDGNSSPHDAWYPRIYVWYIRLHMPALYLRPIGQFAKPNMCVNVCMGVCLCVLCVTACLHYIDEARRMCVFVCVDCMPRAAAERVIPVHLRLYLLCTAAHRSTGIAPA